MFCLYHFRAKIHSVKIQQTRMIDVKRPGKSISSVHACVYKVRLIKLQVCIDGYCSGFKQER